MILRLSFNFRFVCSRTVDSLSWTRCVCASFSYTKSTRACFTKCTYRILLCTYPDNGCRSSQNYLTTADTTSFREASMLFSPTPFHDLDRSIQCLIAKIAFVPLGLRMALDQFTWLAALGAILLVSLRLLILDKPYSPNCLDSPKKSWASSKCGTIGCSLTLESEPQSVSCPQVDLAIVLVFTWSDGVSHPQPPLHLQGTQVGILHQSKCTDDEDKAMFKRHELHCSVSHSACFLPIP